MSQINQDLEDCIAQLRNCFGKLTESNAETLNLRNELARRDAQIKGLATHLANTESRLAQAERAAAKLELFKNTVLAQLQNETETDGSEIDANEPNYGTVSPVFATTRNNDISNLGQAESIDMLMAGIGFHNKQTVASYNNNNNIVSSLPSLPPSRSLPHDLTVANSRDKSIPAASTENNNNNVNDHKNNSNNNNRNSVGDITLDMTTRLFQSKSSPISNIAFERSVSVRSSQTPSSSTTTTSAMVASNTNGNSSSNRNAPTVTFAIKKTAAGIDSSSHPNPNGSSANGSNNKNRGFYSNGSSNIGNGAHSGGAGAGLGSVDGREFFKLARAQLSYDDFTNLLSNVKAYNARDQSRQRTVENLQSLLSKDLFE
ncbi:hypothetical protein HK100_003888, partial [Physocladia obscura]